MESYDDSLKYLIAEAPEDFFRFPLPDSEVLVLGPAECKLPSPGSRDIDGCYRLEVDGIPHLGHVEFHRKHQSLQELAEEVAEAQVRLFRRDGLPVISMVWDLYGLRKSPVLEAVALEFGGLIQGKTFSEYLWVG